MSLEDRAIAKKKEAWEKFVERNKDLVQHEEGKFLAKTAFDCGWFNGSMFWIGAELDETKDKVKAMKDA